MSTATTNFKFIKPELSDPADITELNANWDRIDTELANAGTRIVTANSTDGVTYTADVPYLTELYTGLEITIIPLLTSTVTNPTLNVNGFGAKNIKLALSTNTTATVTPGSANFFVKDKAVKLMFDGTMWKTVDKQRTSASDLYGAVPVENGGTGGTTVAEARNKLGLGNTAGALPVDNGGTGATNGAVGLKNLLAAGNTILSSYQYGDTLPTAGNKGRIFFKKVT